VAYIGDVTDIAHLISHRLKIAEQKVKGYGRTRVSQVRITIYGRSTDIHTDVFRIDRLEELLATRKCVV
jgi:hypothetical protein